MDFIGNYEGYRGIAWFPFSAEVTKRTNRSGWSVSMRDLYEHYAIKHEDSDPQFAARLRETATAFPIVDHPTNPTQRDKDGNLLPEFDEWSELSDEEKIFRGQVNATVAILNRLRFDLENLVYDDESDERVREARKALARLAFD